MGCMDRDAEHWRLRARQQLKDAGVGYRALAQRMGMDYSTIQRQLSGSSSAQGESLYFVRRLCSAMNWSLPRLLFGDPDPGLLQPGAESLLLAPLLDDAGVALWLQASAKDPPLAHILGWFATPSTLTVCGARLFVWQLSSMEFTAMGLPPGSCVYVDPDRQLLRLDPDDPERWCLADDAIRQDWQRLLLCRLHSTGGLLMKKLDCIGNEIWLLPGDHFLEPHKLEDVDVIGAVVASLRDLTLG
ncbi:MAG: hypothetical protein ACR2PT_23705 [Endozoicomonas sp.]